MTYVALALFVLACGWNLYRDYIPTRTRAIRSEGHPQYFGAALAAGYLVAISACFHQAASKTPVYDQALSSAFELAPHNEAQGDKAAGGAQLRTLESTQIAIVVRETAFENLRQDVFPFSKHPLERKTAEADDSRGELRKAFAIALWCALLTFTLPLLLNMPFRLNRRLRSEVTYRHLEAIERLLVDATRQGLSVGVTLTNSKFYAGIPIDTSQDGSSETKWIQVLPLASGFRDEQGRLVLTTTYSDVFEQLDSDESSARDKQDFRVALPVDQIISSQNFDLALYTKHFIDEEHQGDLDTGELTQEQDLVPWWAQPMLTSQGAAETVSGAPPPSRPHLVAERSIYPLLMVLRVAFNAALTLALLCLAFRPEHVLLLTLLAALFAFWISVLPTGVLENYRRIMSDGAARMRAFLNQAKVAG